MFEHSHSRILPRAAFYKRMLRSILFAFLLLFFSLTFGMLGYHHFEKMAWIDSFANAAMILSGMGPLEPLHTWQGKLFAGFYALYSGVTFLIVIALVLAPLVHRFFHKFHFEDEEQESRRNNRIS